MSRTADVPVRSYDAGAGSEKFDHVVTEEPLELRVVAGSHTKTLAVTMRTPGNDFELAAGFILGEQLVRERDDLVSLTYCVDKDIDEEQRFNIVNIALRSTVIPPMERLERHFAITSSCGICGRATLDALDERGLVPLNDDARVSIETIYDLPERMRERQRVFSVTGGLHAAALFEMDGTLVAIREDIGRHNALDKLCGWAMLEGRLPLRRSILVVSGRASYEIVQKAAVAGIPIVCAVSAPSSLAVDLARRFNVTLLGFVRGKRANAYAASERITP
ncbi:MAG: formate dehydrogenase accessory sulfurtransferase FdhD [Candidatus Eremiobacteraeota bacterium]|nr:formate dehydrogenase accessory sulfurtransferase FdhD [Candidatus Eremiobacteraeota bacterium]